MALTLRSVEPNGRPVSGIDPGIGAGVVHACKYVHVCHFRRVTFLPYLLLVILSSLELSCSNSIHSRDGWCNRGTTVTIGVRVVTNNMMLVE